MAGAKTFSDKIKLNGGDNAVVSLVGAEEDLDFTNYTRATIARYVDGANYTLTMPDKAGTIAVDSDLSGKQDTIEDLATIRTQAANGNTALTNLNGLKLEPISQTDYDTKKAAGQLDNDTLYIIKKS